MTPKFSLPPDARARLEMLFSKPSAGDEGQKRKPQNQEKVSSDDGRRIERGRNK